MTATSDRRSDASLPSEGAKTCVAQPGVRTLRRPDEHCPGRHHGHRCIHIEHGVGRRPGQYGASGRDQQHRVLRPTNWQATRIVDLGKSASRVKGLATKPVAPASTLLRSVCTFASLVRITTGISAECGTLSLRARKTPSVSGKFTSIMIKSGRMLRSRPNVTVPSYAKAVSQSFPSSAF